MPILTKIENKIEKGNILLIIFFSMQYFVQLGTKQNMLNSEWNLKIVLFYRSNKNGAIMT